MPDHVHAKRLIVLLCGEPVDRWIHDPRIEEENVDMRFTPVRTAVVNSGALQCHTSLIDVPSEFLCGSADSDQVVQVKLEEFSNLSRLFSEGLDGLIAFLFRARREIDLGVLAKKVLYHLEADSSVPPGDQDNLSRKVGHVLWMPLGRRRREDLYTPPDQLRHVSRG